MPLKISVIIPLYNAGDLIRKCLESLFSQDYDNYEIIVVDDGSSDHSPGVVKEYEVHGPIKLLVGSNEGANSARNHGLDHSTGDLIFFMDQDDFIVNNTFFSRVNSLFKSDETLDFVIFKYVEFFQRIDKLVDRPNFPQTAINTDSKLEKIEALVKNGNVPISPWDKVFRKSFLSREAILFPVGLIAGDINWFIELVSKSKSFQLVNEVFYGYRRQVSTSLTSKMSEEKFKNFLDLIEGEAYNVKAHYQGRLAHAFLSFLAYEFCILLALKPSVGADTFNQYRNQIDSLKWLMNYTLNKKVRYVKILFAVLGENIGVKILNFYIKKVVNKK